MSLCFQLRVFVLQDQSAYLKMLGMYLYTLIIGFKYCNILSILNKLTLQKELHNVVTMCFWTKSKDTTTKKSNNKNLPGAWI